MPAGPRRAALAEVRVEHLVPALRGLSEQKPEYGSGCAPLATGRWVVNSTCSLISDYFVKASNGSPHAYVHEPGVISRSRNRAAGCPG